MAKLTADQKREKIRELERTIENATKEILEILEPPKSSEPPVPPLPKNFSLNERILNVITNNPDGINKDGIIATILRETDVVITPQQTQSALAYLNNTKKLIEIVERGRYRPRSSST